MTALTRGICRPGGRARLGVLLVAAALVIAYAAGEVGDETASAAPEAEAAAVGLTVTPASGQTHVESLSFGIPAPCPTGSDGVIVEITGAGFPAGSFALGLTSLDTPSQTTFNTATWSSMATNNGATVPLNGPANLKLICATGQEPSGADYTTTVSFTPTTGVNSSYQTAASGTPTPTPVGGTPIPTPTRTPTPTPGGGTPAPTPAPTPTPTPTPSQTATPTPSESPAPTDVDTDGTDGTDDDPDVTSDGNLPGAGAQNPSMPILAAMMLGFLGLALLLFEAGFRPEEDGT